MIVLLQLYIQNPKGFRIVLKEKLIIYQSIELGPPFTRNHQLDRFNRSKWKNKKTKKKKNWKHRNHFYCFSKRNPIAENFSQSSMYHKLIILILNLLLLLLLFVSEAASFSVGSRSILRSISNGENNGEVDNAVELNATNFDTVLRDTLATYAVVEFFAHWLVVMFEFKLIN